MAVETRSKAGLEDVVAGESAICYLDGERGVLAYHGYDIHDLAHAERGASFEEVCFLLWHGRLPARAELGDLQTQLASARVLPEPIIRAMRSLPRVDGMDALRTLTSIVGHYDADAAERSPQANYRKAVRLTGQIGALVATWGRMAAGGGPIDPDPALGHAANFLYLLTGQRPSALATRAFDVSLVLHADHELNASTFAARVAAATLTDIHSTIVAAIGTLKGPLHGGANERALEVLMSVGSVDKAEAWTRQMLARKEKVMGFGHRVYKDGDPRAVYLKKLVAPIAVETGNEALEATAEAIERILGSEKKIPPNVDWPCARLYHYLGLPPDLFTPLFVSARVVGWSAHVIEQLDNNRIMRPRSIYRGPSLRKWAPIEQRG
jgi:2-methylcitrate synthase